MALVSNKIRPIVAMGEDLVKTMKASDFNKLLKQMADAVKKGTPADVFYKTHKMLLVEGRSHALNSRFSRFVETVQYAWNRLVNKFKPRDWQFAFGHERLRLHHTVCDDFQVLLRQASKFDEVPAKTREELVRDIGLLIKPGQSFSPSERYKIIVELLELEFRSQLKPVLAKKAEAFEALHSSKSRLSKEQMRDYVDLLHTEGVKAGKQAALKLAEGASLKDGLDYMNVLGEKPTEDQIIAFCKNRLNEIREAYRDEVHIIQNQLPQLVTKNHFGI